ncbi:MAG: biotin/lipoyl-binding protein, partial [Acidobacteriota bacterium]|nr:biotin/lipoyl-binding protein [Acidobacteriota bacterium]
MPKAEQTEFADRYSLRKMGRRLIVVLLVVVAFFIVKARFLTPLEVVAARAGKETVPAEVQGTGTVAVDVLATVGAKIPGRIARVFVDQGDFVHQGQIVAELEDTDILRDVQQAEARLAAARAEELAARATLEARRATQWQTGRDWWREKHLVATGAVSQEEADEYKESNLTAISAVGAAEAEVGAAESEISSAEAAVRLQRFILSETKIFSYMSGVVIDLPKRPGDAIVAGEPVVTVA